MASRALQTATGEALAASLRGAGEAVEARLEAERDQLPLWLPIGIGLGIAGWFALPDAGGWTALLLAAGAVTSAGFAIGRELRSGRALIWFGLAVAIGCGLVWARAGMVAAPVLERPIVERFEAEVESVRRLPARDSVRLVLRPIGAARLPPRVRVNVPENIAPERVAAGDRLRLRARLMPPPAAAVPGAYDFARIAWFQGLGATGRAFAPIERIGGEASGPGLRERLSTHIQARLPGSAGAVAMALATGDQGAISDEDAEAMRRSGLAHLLSVSGLHVTAVVGAAMLIVIRLLALSPTLALRWPLLLIAAGAGALAGVGYTLLSGAEVPTIRSCVAALLVLGGLAMGRDAITLRLVAAGALFVLLLWPEALIGPSFQLSFAAVTAIVALHEHPRVKALLAKRDEDWTRRGGRILLSLLLTGIAVEVALTPIALFHFNKAGLYGAFANIVAIPLTTFVVMPLEALALLLDLVGLGAPAWWLTGIGLEAILAIAHGVANAPGSVTAFPTMPRGAFALMIGGGLWLLLWRTSIRRWGAVPLTMGAAWAMSAGAPDIIVTGDGRHLAVRKVDGSIALLRPRAGDYVRDVLSESAGFDGEPGEIDVAAGARCSADACIVDLKRGGRTWRLLATRSSYFVEPGALARACRRADIVVSDRWLPRTCVPRWLKADRKLLAETGGLSIDLSSGAVKTVGQLGGRHPWVEPERPATR